MVGTATETFQHEQLERSLEFSFWHIQTSTIDIYMMRSSRLSDLGSRYRKPPEWPLAEKDQSRRGRRNLPSSVLGDLRARRAILLARRRLRPANRGRANPDSSPRPRR